MAIFSITNGEASNLAVVKVTPQEFECFTLYEYIITTNNGDSITITINGNDFESKYIQNGVETTFSDTATFSFSNTATVSFLLLNSGVQGVFPNATIRIDNNTTAAYYENFVERENDEANCYNSTTAVTSTSQLLNDGETGASTYVEFTDLVGSYLPLAGGTMSGNINGGEFELQNFSRLDITDGTNTILNNWSAPGSIYRLGKVAGSQLQYNNIADEWRIDGSRITTESDIITASDVTFSSYLTLTSADVQAAIQELKDEVDAIVASSGSGDMLKATYDTGDNGIVDNSEALGGLTSSQFLRSDAFDVKDNGNLRFNDNILVSYGTGDDLVMYHNGSQSVINSANGFDLQFWTDGTLRWTLDNTTGDLLANSTNLSVQDEAYGVSWNGSTEVPTKNAVYDQIESIIAGGVVSWGGITGTLSDQTDLQSALDLKLDASTYTAADVLAKLLTVDGTGSGLSADNLDGIDSGGFVRNTLVGGQTVNSTITDLNLGGTGLFYADAGATNKAGGANHFGISLDLGSGFTSQIAMRNDQMWFRTEESSTWGSWREIYHEGNEGPGSGLNADLLDGTEGANFLRSDTADTANGIITYSALQGAVTFDNAGNSGILRGDNTQRMLIGGGSNWTGTDGAYLELQGIDYTGVGAGGNVRFLLPSGAQVSMNQPLLVGSTSIVADAGTTYSAVIDRREVGGFDYDSYLAINGGNGGALWGWVNGNGTNTFLEQNSTLRYYNGTDYVWTLNSAGAVSQDGTLTIVNTEYSTDRVNTNGASEYSFLNGASALSVNLNNLVVSSNYTTGRANAQTNGIFALGTILSQSAVTAGIQSVSNGTFTLNKSDGGTVAVAYEDDFFRYRRGGSGTIQGWRWDNFDTTAATLTTAGALTVASVNVTDDPYDSAWNGSTQTPTKNAVYDQLESLTSEATGTSGMVLEGSTSGTYSISSQSWGWYRYGKLVTFYIGLSNVNGTTPLGDLRIDTSGTSMPLMTGTNVFAVETTGIGNSFYSIHGINIGADLLEFRIQTTLSNANNTAVINANFSGTEDIFISGSYITV